jgi:hypothetical protein
MHKWIGGAWPCGKVGNVEIEFALNYAIIHRNINFWG